MFKVGKCFHIIGGSYNTIELAMLSGFNASGQDATSQKLRVYKWRVFRMVLIHLIKSPEV
jgi:hypothetical protein